MIEWDPEMRAVRTAMDAAAAREPPVLMTGPMDPNRVINERLALPWAEGGPVMAHSADRWLLAEGRRVLCRVHRPATDKPCPVLVWFHGGGWVFSSIDTHDRLARELAAASGYAVVSVDYALSPEARFPRALLECVAVIRQLAHTDWGLDAGRIVLGGDSAGGNLAFAAALMLRDGGGPALRGILALYPVTDSDLTRPSYTTYADGFGLTGPGMGQFWDLYVRDAADYANPLATPLRANLAGMPPTLIQLAALDVLRSEGEAMAEKLTEAAVPTELKIYPGVLHGFMRLSGHVTPARTAIADAGHWLAAHA